jgi:hypothetical protein
VQQSTTRRQRRKTRHIASDGAATKHTWQCGRDCHSQISLTSHTRRCTKA